LYIDWSRYAKIPKIAEPKPGEDMAEILKRHAIEKKLVVETKKNFMGQNARVAEKRFYIEWYFEELHATISKRAILCLLRVVSCVLFPGSHLVTSSGGCSHSPSEAHR
jgi:hypothetical protein